MASWDTGRVGNAIEGFYTTWSSTRKTFGEGPPQTGEQFENSSSALRGLDTNMAAAAPGSRWKGAAATAYDVANTEHRKVITQLADLDKRMTTEVNNAAQVVTAGRQDLESVRQWVADAEGSVPPGKAGEQMKLIIAQKGLAQIQAIVAKTNADSNAIGGRVLALNGDYQKLGNQRFAPKEGEGPLDIIGNDTTDDKDTRGLGQGHRRRVPGG
jgi:uncharacterized protein YukE